MPTRVPSAPSWHYCSLLTVTSESQETHKIITFIPISPHPLFPWSSPFLYQAFDELFFYSHENPEQKTTPTTFTQSLWYINRRDCMQNPWPPPQRPFCHKSLLPHMQGLLLHRVSPQEDSQASTPRAPAQDFSSIPFCFPPRSLHVSAGRRQHAQRHILYL